MGTPKSAHALVAVFVRHRVDALWERAGQSVRGWLPNNHFIEGADLAITAAVAGTSCELLNGEFWNMSMFTNLKRPY